jgi:pimeloyl-ACP methyl ester carboxylesterase
MTVGALETLCVMEWVEPGAVVDPPAVLVHGTLSWGTLTFDRQRPLAARRRLLVPDRRGFGDSPDLHGSPYTSDYEVDARDVIDLLAAGAHLVGHSYGAVVAMLAAATRPDLVRSLALIEPPAHMLAIGNTAVAAAVAAAATAELVTVPGAGHDVQRDQPERTNTLLSRLWSTGDGTLPS